MQCVYVVYSNCIYYRLRCVLCTVNNIKKLYIIFSCEIKTDFMCRGGQGELRAGLAGLGVFFKDNIYYNTGNPVMWWWWSGGVVSKKRPRYIIKKRRCGC